MEEREHPVAGVNYPCTFGEFDEWFAEESACRAFLIALRWPGGFVCPRCGLRQAPWTTARGYLHCRTCEGEVSPTAGTLFERTRTPLRLWFLAIWFVTSQKHGASALGLQRVLGLGTYRTAWTWLHKLRRAMVRPGRDRLTGVVEVDETYLGGPEEGVQGRETECKAIVAIAVERRGRALGRIRLGRVADVSGDSLIAFITDAVTPGARIHTDGWAGYSGVPKAGYQHRVTNLSATIHTPHEAMPGVHRVASLLKRWLLGTHHGGIQPQHLDYYLDEFTFRFHRRSSGSRGLLFYRLMQHAAAIGPTTYAQLIGGRNAQ
ncbi:MAG: IS1595 family transposase [Candidatus Latescibacterota bacterium]